MKKKYIAALLAASMCLNFTVPAFSAETEPDLAAETTEADLTEDNEESLRRRAKIVFLQQMEVNDQLTEIFNFISNNVEEAKEAQETSAAATIAEDEKLANDFITVVDSTIVLVQDIMEKAGTDTSKLDSITASWDETKKEIESEIDKAKQEAAEAETETEEPETAAEEDFDMEEYFDSLSLEEQLDVLEIMLFMYEAMAKESITYLAKAFHLDFLLDAFGLTSFTEESIDFEDEMESEVEEEEEEFQFSPETRLDILEAKSELVSSIVNSTYELLAFAE